MGTQESKRNRQRTRKQHQNQATRPPASGNRSRDSGSSLASDALDGYQDIEWFRWGNDGFSDMVNTAAFASVFLSTSRLSVFSSNINVPVLIWSSKAGYCY